MSTTATTTGTPLLILDSVSVTYPSPTGDRRLTVLDNINLTVDTGQLMCVAGRSGSGKTTLLNVACALITPTAGQVLVHDQPLEDLSADERADWRRHSVGIVLQSDGLIPTLTAAENTVLPGVPDRIHRHDRERAAELLAEVGLEGRHSHFPDQLSGGERKRVEIARALFNEPTLLVVDEPTASLDRRLADEMIDLLHQLTTSDLAILAASHDPHLVQRANSTIHLT